MSQDSTVAEVEVVTEAVIEVDIVADSVDIVHIERVAGKLDRSIRVLVLSTEAFLLGGEHEAFDLTDGLHSCALASTLFINIAPRIA
jgi:hypothetical protein